MDKKILLIALIMGAVSIILGAFGAHGLKKILTVDQLNTFEVGVRYQMYHALFLLFVANNSIVTVKEKGIVLYLVVIGIILFSGSIYLLSTANLTGLKTKLMGPLTPIGGLLLIASWLYVFYCVFAKK